MENFNCKMYNLCLRTCFEAIEYLFWDKKGLSKQKKKATYEVLVRRANI